MTAAFLLLCLVGAGAFGATVIHLDKRAERDRADEERMTAPLPHARQSLMPVRDAYPARQSPTDLAAVYLPAMYHAEPVPGMRWMTEGYLFNHPRMLSWSTIKARLERERRGTPTQEFDRIMAVEFEDWRCESCLTGRDGERQHQSCASCSCPCSVPALAEVAA